MTDQLHDVKTADTEMVRVDESDETSSAPQPPVTSLWNLRRDNSEEPNLIAALERITSFDNNWGIRIGGHVLHSAGSLPAEKPFHLL